MSFKQFRTIDILIFSAIAIVFELLNYFATTSLGDFQLIFMSYSIVLSLVAIYRWGLRGSVVAFLGGIAACAVARSTSFPHYVGYSVGNLIGVILGYLIFQIGIGKEKLMKHRFSLLCLYLFVDFLFVVIFRCLIICLFDISTFWTNFIGSLRSEVVFESMSFVISIIILIVCARKNGNIMVEMKEYVYDVQNKKKLGGLKELQESPYFNKDAPFTEPQEFDEYNILEGGTLNNEELDELQELYDNDGTLPSKKE